MREVAGLSDEEFIMAFVRVEQRNAHLASAVRLVSVQARDGQPVRKATLTAISNIMAYAKLNRCACQLRVSTPHRVVLDRRYHFGHTYGAST
jgi:hypothetical protein